MALGALVLLGWALNLPLLKSVRPGWENMKVSTAIGFILAGIAILAHAKGTLRARQWSRGLALILVWRGGLRLWGSSGGLNWALDQGLFVDDSLRQGSMAALTGFNFVLCGAAILFLGVRWKRCWPSEWLASLMGLLALMALLGKAYNAPQPFFAQAFSTVAFHTSVAFLACSLAIKLAEPRHAVASVLADGGPGGIIARRLLPAALLIPVLLGWLSLNGENAGLFSTEFALTLLVLACIVCGVIFSLWAAHAAKRSGYALNQKEELQRVTLQSIGDGVIAVGLDGRVTILNRVAEKLTGWKQAEALGQSMDEVFHIHKEGSLETMPNPVERALRSDQAFELSEPFVLVARGGGEVLVADSTAPIHDAEEKLIGAVLVFRDVTEKQRAKKELLKLQKLESLAVLAGGIAHDFNNILTIILANVSLAAEEKGAEQAERLRDAEAAVIRGSQLAVQLMAFSKGSAAVRKVFGLRQVIQEAAKFALTGTSSRVELDLKGGLDAVEADAGQISQVIQNLVLNASQAMPSGGLVHVSMEGEFIPEGSGLPLEPGRYFKVVVLDEGHGMSPEVLLRIFDPFFTTKAHGNGLGLASAFNIAKSHHGHLMAESAPGQGSAFSLYLPASARAIEEQPLKSIRAARGQGRVLVMDDDAHILKVTLLMLESLGYRTQGSADGKAAIALVEEGLRAGDPFDVAILDMTVQGGMGGREALSQMLKLQPNLLAIMASGYSADPIMEQHTEHGFAAAMPKPYNLHHMGVLLNRLIGA